jgi:hypothetical protein
MTERDWADIRAEVQEKVAQRQEKSQNWWGKCSNDR